MFNSKLTTIKGYEIDLRMLCLYLHNPEIEAVSLEDILNHLKEMRAFGWDENTFVRKCAAFRIFFSYCRRRGYVVMDPELIPRPRKQYQLPRVADEENYQKLVSAIPRDDNSRNVRNLAIVNMLWDTGARNGEICSLNVSDLDLHEMKAVIRTEKAKWRRPFREIFWTPPTNENLKRWLWVRERLQTRPKQKVVPKEKDVLFFSLGAGRSGLRINVKGIGEMLRRASNTAGIPILNAHSFRHHMGHDIIKKGGTNSDISNILGHSSLESSYIYTMMTNKELHERYKNFKKMETFDKA